VINTRGPNMNLTRRQFFGSLAILGSGRLPPRVRVYDIRSAYPTTMIRKYNLNAIYGKFGVSNGKR
jgi:hypothetical protein